MLCMLVVFCTITCIYDYSSSWILYIHIALWMVGLTIKTCFLWPYECMLRPSKVNFTVCCHHLHGILGKSQNSYMNHVPNTFLLHDEINAILLWKKLCASHTKFCSVFKSWNYKNGLTFLELSRLFYIQCILHKMKQ